jgi:hypothetical protein
MTQDLYIFQGGYMPFGNKQGRSLNKFSKEKLSMPEDPTIIDRAQVIVHCSSLDKTDSVIITTTIPR